MTMLRKGDWVRVKGTRSIARVFCKTRIKRQVPGIVILDRKIGKYWSYSQDQLIRLMGVVANER